MSFLKQSVLQIIILTQTPFLLLSSSNDNVYQ